MKKLFLIITIFTVLLLVPNTAFATTVRCQYDSMVDVCKIVGSCPPGTSYNSNLCPAQCAQDIDIPCTTAPVPPATDCTDKGGICTPQSAACGQWDNATTQCKAATSQSCCLSYTSPSPLACTGQALATYMNAVIAGAGNIPNVKLLSPAFNMTSSTFDDIVNSIGTAGGNFNALDGIAGNAYNVDNRRVTSWLTEKLKNPYVSGKPFYLTETGEKDFADGKIGIDEAIARLKPELDALRTYGNPWNARAALLFNGLGTNSNFSTFQWSVDNLKVLCGGSNCGTVGINQASFFSQSDTIYSIMRDQKMLFDLEIATSGSLDAVIRAVNALPDGNVIVRIGVGDDSGGFSDPATYVKFIQDVASKTSKTVYFIAGPNEPDSEFWADPQCKTNQLPAKKGPLEEGFNPQNPNLACDKTKEQEYNPLRPYPGNPCDPLIPRSIPEAPLTSEKKFNTFACGASLTPRREEVFDPYGNNGYYEGLPGPEGYAHTVCDPVPDNVKKNGGLVTCWRSSAFDVTVDLSHANLGVLSNTQDTSLTDAQKVNEYLSWYLTGTPQIGDQIPVDPNNPKDIGRVVNFSGPLRKILPLELQNALRSTIALSNGQNGNPKLVHNSIVGCQKSLSQQYFIDVFTKFFESTKSAASDVVGFIYYSAKVIADLVQIIFSAPEILNALGQAIKDLQSFDIPNVIKDLSQACPNCPPGTLDDLSHLINIAGAPIRELGELLQTISLDAPVLCTYNNNGHLTSGDQKRLLDYNARWPDGKLPPRPQDYATFDEFWKKYLNWRGYTNVWFFGPQQFWNPFVNGSVWAKLFQNIPFSSMEDTAGEYTMSVFRDPANNQQIEGLGDQKYSSVVNKNTAPLQLLIKSASLAAP